jgi:glutathione S-transferase
MTLLLYDLAGRDERRRFSPYCWRTRLALAHKGLDVETIPWRFTDKDAIARSGQTKVPVLVDEGEWIWDSWEIAVHLERKYPYRPSLFAGNQGLTRLYSSLADRLVASIFPLIAPDILSIVHEKDVDYFRTSREKRSGKRLEDLVTDRAERLKSFRESLQPFRTVAASQPYFGGENPRYADYALFGPFQWTRCTSPLTLLDDGDPLRVWFERMLDLFGGLGRYAPALETD